MQIIQLLNVGEKNLKILKKIKIMKLSGINVTLPYKQKIIPLY